LIALATFRLAAYIRSHRMFQALLLALAMLAILYGSRAPRGGEASALTDGAVLIIPILAWATRSLLDTEPDQQRELSAIQVGGRGKEVAAGLMAAFATCVAFAALGMGAALLLGVSQAPSRGVLAAALVLNGLAALTGTALGALTSRAVIRSPALSIMGLLLGFLAMLLLSSSPLHWLTVPLIAWMKAANGGHLLDQLPELGAISLAWCLIGLGAYVWLRRRVG
jgi:hypothetical protein